MKRSWALGLLFAVACGGKPAGDVVQMQDVVPPQPAPLCTVDAASIIYRSRGALDLNIAPTGGYFAAVRMRNVTATSNLSVDTKFGPFNDVGVNNTNINIDGVNLCYEVREDTDIPKDASAGCNEIKGVVKAFAPGNTLLTAATISLISVDILPPGVFSQLGISLARGQSTRVDVHVQATGHNASGSTVNSNEMIYPIQVCNGCLSQDPAECPKDPSNRPLYNLSTACSPGQDDPIFCAEATAPAAR